MNHPVDETLFAYILGELSPEEYAVIAQHLSDCALCAGVHVELVEIERVSHDPATWTLVDDSFAIPDPERVRDFTERIARKEREDAAATDAMRELRLLPLASWEAWLHYRPALHTVGMVAGLLSEARRRVSATPRDSLQIVSIATDLAAHLDDPSDHLTMTGLAANERATVLRMLGRGPEALAAVDEAAVALSSLNSAPDEKARVAWNRATVLFTMERYAEARAALYEPKDWFRSIGDSRELARIGILEGSILHDEGDRAGALEVFTRVVDILENDPEHPDLALVYANIAFCHLALGTIDAARMFGRRAMAIYERAQMLGERIHTRWMFAQILVERDDMEEGLRELEAVTNEYEGAEMIDRAAQVTLERVEILLRLDAWDDAAVLARRLLSIYERTGQHLSHVRALAHLREAVEASRATPELARYVRGYIAAEGGQSFRPPAASLPS